MTLLNMTLHVKWLILSTVRYSYIYIGIHILTPPPILNVEKVLT